MDPVINLKKMDQNFPFGGLIGLLISCMEFFCKLKISRLHAILHDSAGSVNSNTKKELEFNMLPLVFSVHVFLVT